MRRREESQPIILLVIVFIYNNTGAPIWEGDRLKMKKRRKTTWPSTGKPTQGRRKKEGTKGGWGWGVFGARPKVFLRKLPLFDFASHRLKQTNTM